MHGTSAITAITAQNTLGVTAIQELPVEIIRAQIDAVVTDLAPAAAKTGMLSSVEIIETVAAAVREHRLAKLVVDPVMVAKGGAKLLRDEAVAALRELLLPLAAVVTPNLPEAEVLAGMRVETRADMEEAARRILALGPRAVLVKGGHLKGDAVDVLWNGHEFTVFSTPRVESPSTHGTGCTFSAAITAGVSRGHALGDAIRAAKAYVTNAIREGFTLGRGVGQLRHFLTEW